MLTILTQTFLIPWNKLEPTQSIFIPCLDRRTHEIALLKEAKRLGIKVKSKQVVENGRFGLRLWRIK